MFGLLSACSSSSTPTTESCPSIQAQCLRGGPCSCNDQADGNVCQSAGTCPAGYTRYQDCRGVPPGPSCFGDAAADTAPDCAGSRPMCVRGGPCSCDDQVSNNGVPICQSGVWSCPAGYTRFEDCRGIPPGPSCFGDAATRD